MYRFFWLSLFGNLPAETGYDMGSIGVRVYAIILVAVALLFFLEEKLDKDIISTRLYKFFLLVAGAVGLTTFAVSTTDLLNPRGTPYRLDVAIITLVMSLAWLIVHVVLIKKLNVKKELLFTLFLFTLLLWIMHSLALYFTQDTLFFYSKV